MPIELGLLVAASAAVGLAVAWLTGPLRQALIYRGIYDAPNARSSHQSVKPRGGGLAVLAVVLPAWLVAGWWVGGQAPVALVGLSAAVAALSFVDDVRGLGPGPRLLGQFAAVVAGLISLDPASLMAGWLPLWLERGLVAVAWLWFVNLYNFMDGIDGITSVETVTVALGLGLVALVTGAGTAGAVLPWLLAGACAGFLWWNWAPSRIFLGDVGSVSLGFALGWLLLELAARGHLAAALILPGYYLLDTTATLLRRLLRGEKVWRAHKQHAYQRAVQAGLSHAAVAGRIAVANAILIGCALWAVAGAPIAAGALAALVAVGLWASLRRGNGAREGA